ncbi:MAG TPA: glycosyltransferase family 39 protein, partial [Acidimicrobiales bacterium]|nr:glycosyltransferase family 39 protein [Acidimicrobiales bacterium]
MPADVLRDPATARRPRRALRAPVVVALAGAVVALLSAYVLAPQGSVNLDEVVYLNQAEAIAHGHLTYDADAYTPDLRPYLTGLAGDRLVFKYQPLWPALLAAAGVTTGDHRPALVVAGAAAALAFWLLARELTGRAGLAAAAAVGVTLSPVFVAHSGTALAYLPAAALGAAALAAALRAGTTGGLRWAAAAGLGLGLLFFHRPYDAVIVGAPVGIWLLWRARAASRWRPVVVLGAAALPGLVIWLAY